MNKRIKNNGIRTLDLFSNLSVSSVVSFPLISSAWFEDIVGEAVLSQGDAESLQVCFEIRETTHASHSTPYLISWPCPDKISHSIHHPRPTYHSYIIPPQTQVKTVRQSKEGEKDSFSKGLALGNGFCTIFRHNNPDLPEC